MKRILIAITAILFSTSLFAQGSDDACLFSQTYYQGTAKSLGMANALGAVGGDMTAVCINPAGMGLYRSNEFTTTINLLHNLYNNNYYGENTNAGKFRVTMPNIGYVGVKERSNYRKLRFTQFGIGLTRTNEFNSHTHAQGINTTSSKIDDYLNQIDGYNPNELQEHFPFTVFPAWQTYLIDIYQDSLGDYYSSPVPQGGIWQSQDNRFKGRAEEWTFAGSANYGDCLFIGGSIGLAHIKREGTRCFEEWMPDNSSTVTDFQRWRFEEFLSSSAWGINLKLGFIAHLNHWMRIGASFHSPTLYNFSETWQTETESRISQVVQKSISPESHYEYSFVSPLKCIASTAFVIGHYGLVSLDAEYTNFGAARFKADDYDYSVTNQTTKATYGHTLNFRLGSEWRMDGFYLRAGGAYYGSPYGFGKNEGSVKKASLGISLPVSESTTFDFAYELTFGKDRFTLYNAGELGIEAVTQRQIKNNLAATLRMRF